MRPVITAPSRAAAVLAALVLSTAVPHAQQATPAGPQPAHDTPVVREIAGAGRLSVSVVAADTGLPVRRVRVAIAGTAIGARPPATVAGPLASVRLVPGSEAPPARVQKEGETDDRGRVEFAGLPTAPYLVTVEVPSPYVRQRLTPSAFVEDGGSASLTIRLERGGVIAGRIVDEAGEPVSRATVRAIGRNIGGVAGLFPTGSPVMSDDRGQFRLFGLLAGEYFVSARYATSSSIGSTSSWQPRIGYVPTYYPGSATLDAARTVSVRAGQDTTDADFALLQGRLGRVVGTAMDSAGNPLPPRAASVNLMSRTADPFTQSLFAPLLDDGTFAINDVPPGDYYLIVRIQRREGSTAETEGALVPVTVNGEEVTASVRTNAGATLSGHVVIEGSGKSVSVPGGPVFPGGRIPVRVSTRPPTGVVSFPSFAPGRPDTASEDGTFRLTGVRGLVLLSGSTIAAGVVTSIRRGGEDLMRVPLLLTGSESIDDIEVVVATDTGALGGAVTDTLGQPAPGVFVVVFPDDPRDWFYGSPFVRPTRSMTVQMAAASAARRAAAAQPGGGTGAEQPGPPASTGVAAVPRSPGQFLFPHLLPGRYCVVAFENPEGVFPQFDKEFLSSLRPRATLVDVPAGETATVTVRVGK